MLLDLVGELAGNLLPELAGNLADELARDLLCDLLPGRGVHRVRARDVVVRVVPGRGVQGQSHRAAPMATTALTTTALITVPSPLSLRTLTTTTTLTLLTSSRARRCVCVCGGVLEDERVVRAVWCEYKLLSGRSHLLEKATRAPELEGELIMVKRRPGESVLHARRSTPLLRR